MSNKKGHKQAFQELLLITLIIVFYDKRSLNLFFTGITKFKDIGIQLTKTDIGPHLLYPLCYNFLKPVNLCKYRRF